MGSLSPLVMSRVADTPDESLREKALLQVAVTRAFACLSEGAAEQAVASIAGYTDIAAKTDVGCYVFGLIYFNAQQAEHALEWFERALAHQPDYPEALTGRAVLLQRFGRSQEALASFERILRQRPEDAEALYMCGVILQSLGRATDALWVYDKALRVKPLYAEALINRGALLEQLGRFEEALASLDAAIEIKPGDGTILFNRGSVLQRLGRNEDALEAYLEAARHGLPDPEIALNCGNVLQKLGRPGDALTAYDEALKLRPAYPQAHYNRAIALQGLGRIDAAIAAYDEALALEPDYHEALCNRGNALHERGDDTAALASYAAALKLKPDLELALVNRANVLLYRGSPAEALISCDEALRHAPGHAQALCIRGAALSHLGRFEEALDSLDAALKARPLYPEALLNRGNVLQELGRLPEAIASYDAALAARSNYAEALSGRGVALKEQGHIDMAIASFNQALTHKPDYPDARNNRAGALFLRGDLSAGFEDYESRWDRSNAPRKTFHSEAPAWKGQPLAGQNIIVWDEQGLGDLIQFSRYLPLLTKAGADVSFLCRKSMHRLLSSMPNAVRLIEQPDPADNFAFHSALMSLPRGFGTTLATIPASIPYLRAEPLEVARWASRIGEGGFKIGICWQGNSTINLLRTIPLAAFAPLTAIEGVRLISLMKEPTRADLDTCARMKIEILEDGFDKGADAFIDTAAVMAGLDLVITSDTSIAHLAGALGRPVFLGLKHVPDWRWLLEGGTSPWYPTMQLFRQRMRGDWTSVFSEIAACVEDRVKAATQTGPNSIQIPGAVGELIDKITILEIKTEAIRDTGKLSNVRRELQLLQKVRADGAFNGPKLTHLEEDLKATNRALWQLEDALRLHERQQDFGPEFVNLARQVYKTNDHRAALKKEISAMFNSAIVEEKSYAM